ncbi:MAG TPA: hypothetical protein VFK48_17090 [Usitatibacter sp.]|nr:hypothetical protein [Usitatibacter sp.]
MAKLLHAGIAWFTLSVASWGAIGAAPEQAPATDAAALKEKHRELRAQLERNAFGRPIHLDSREHGGELQGQVHAVLDHPFEKVRDGLAGAQSWCEIMVLPFNVKRCDARGGDRVSLFIARKKDTPIEETVRIDFRFSQLARGDDFLKVQLAAPSGPLGTKNYRIVLSAVPLDRGRTFMHMSYGYAYGTMSRIAMQAYLATSGADKVGFSSEGSDEQGRPRLVGGMRGVTERNTMRYFLAIDAYLDALSAPVAARLQKRLEGWFSAADRYARQLREMTRDEYLEMKARDLADAARPAPGG